MGRGVQLTMIFSKELSWILIGVTVLGAVASFSYSLGQKDTREEWQKETIKHQNELLKVEEIHKQALQEYIDKNNNLQREIVDVKKDYEARLHNINDEYSVRLSESEQRAKVYKRMSEQGKCQSTDLSDYATKLDRSLTEGRQVVKLLRETIELRDNQLRQIGEQLKQMEKLHE